MAEITVRIPAIHCAGCINTVKMVLRTVDGAELVSADANAKAVRLSVADDDARQRAFRELDAIGYTAELLGE